MAFAEEPGSTYSDEVACALGERYGGPGLAGNGGGVRCGIVAGVQIKGIGRNPLAGTTTDYWHTHGALSLQDAVRETIWSEILAAALPFGAIRSLAVISTGTRFNVEIGESKSPGTAPRALLLREAALRPAHYMRSVFFAPGMEMRDHISDVHRTRNAVQAIPKNVESWFSRGVLGSSNSAPGAAVSAALLEVARRAAAQISASRAKRLIHGSLIGSNFCLDGRWLDFGTITSVSCFDDAVVAPGSASFWSQESSVKDALRDLRFYLGKYLGIDLRETLIPMADIEQAFTTHLRQREDFEFLKLTGFPVSLLNQASAEVCSTLGLLISKLARSGTQRRFLYFGDDRHAMPAVPSHSVTSLLRLCAVSRDRPTLSRAIEATSLSHVERDSLVRSYWALRDEVITSAAVNPNAGNR
jgi:hypothetical protein